ncbi:MAG TPA: PIG-L family deacetylase [Oligoflexia bacterium]|nr:PIG-L family deacetylase [Oligoflexia bacterium]HMP48439.1 PIG-L family deacetylase [Oligoflexia bacterium]
MKELNHSALIINAHPDDGEMAMGGTLLLLVKAGYKVTNVSLTGGEAGTFGSKEIREKEFINAQKFLGSEGILLDFPDTALENTVQARHAVVQIIREKKPGIVFAPYLRNDDADFHGMNNRDHPVAGHIASEAVKLARLKNVLPEYPPHHVPLLLFYMIAPGKKATLIVDVTEVYDDIKILISHYQSQLQLPQNTKSGNPESSPVISRLIAHRINDGSSRRVKYAESFISEMPLLISDLKNLALL